MIAIVNYNMGNVRSVANILSYLGVESCITKNPAELASAQAIILPGVGAFGEAMKNIAQAGLIEPLRHDILEKKKPFLGICLGMQLIMGKSFEGGEWAGLGFIPGEVRRITPSESTLRIPHIGWNDVVPQGETRMYGADRTTRVFYFVHSYHAVPKDDAVISGTVEYGGSLAASIEKENIWATQFHPEKSQKDGIALLKNFLTFVDHSNVC